MIKQTIRKLTPGVWMVIMGFLLIGASACATTLSPVAALTVAVMAPTSVDVTIVDETGNTQIEQDILDQALSGHPPNSLSESEIEGLLYMREEEKLARDVYLVLYEKWNMSIFENIARSESTHMDAVKTLLDRYGLEDPAADMRVGEFQNQALQALYDQLIAQGEQSLAQALRVGAAIEEIDILDLEKHTAETESSDIQLVYQNLLKGSRNHLRSFTKTLQRKTGEPYQPQYLDQGAYEVIVEMDIERGRGRNVEQTHGRNQGG